MKILLVDDDMDCRTSVGKFLRKIGHQVVEASSGKEALAVYLNDDFPMIITDIKMPEMSGIELMRAIRDTSASFFTEIVLFTGHGTIESAVEALRMGAFDYLLKPINIQELKRVAERVGEHQTLRRENRILTHHFHEELKSATEETAEENQRLRKLIANATGIHDIGIYSSGMQEIIRYAQMFHHDRRIPVLIYGETGTGKELIARIIHSGESGVDAPFVDINCAALTPSLFESELFGYEAGSFTGSLSRGQKGKFDLAEGGTLFLDEIGDMPLEMQTKLLRVLQEKEYYRVGGLKKVKTDVRIICATNIDLIEAMEKGLFRKDLYYRLNVGELSIPPLRERQESILQLAEMFLKQFSIEKGKQFVGVSEEAAQVLCTYSWPGNVRELRNAIEWAVFMFEGPMLCEHQLRLSATTPSTAKAGNIQPIQPSQPLNLPDDPFALDDFIDKIVITALEKFGGNRSAAADYLGWSRRTLAYRVDKLSTV